jgi:hypothetical protein
MHFILEPLFTMFGKRAIGQLAGGTLVGAAVPALTFLRKGEIPPGGYFVWSIGGAVAGLTGGLFLLSPKRFFGSIFTVLGLVIVFVPMSRTDGLPVGLQEHLIKFSIGLILFALGALLLVRAWKRLK